MQKGKIILHIDMNSYFASVEQQANPFLCGKPIAITGKKLERSVVCTASLEAKKLGVKTAMSTWEAKRICPSLIFVAGDPEKYSEITHRFNAIFEEFTDYVEQFSVDESFLDITDCAKDYTGAVFIAQMIRARLQETCGEKITASIGIASNKLLAKLASEQVKPNGLTVVQPRQVIEFMDSVDLQDICGIGRRIAERLDEFGICSVKQLREFPVNLLVEEFKSYGYWLHNSAYGLGDYLIPHQFATGGCTRPSPFSRGSMEGVNEDRDNSNDPKSVGHTYTLPHDTWDPLEIKRYLLIQADKVAWRLRRDGLKAQCIHAYIRYGDFTGQGKQASTNEPTDDGMRLFKIAWNLIRQFVPPLFKGGLPPEAEGGVNESFRRTTLKPVRLVGLSASHLTRGPEQISIFKKERKIRSVLSALDKIQHRYGEHTWTRASLINIELKQRSSGFNFDHEL
ncbi:MAG: DNA polymerase IV [Patescibacteria group bacterium]